jgi:ABC-type transport system substrate-binding protein
VRRRPARRAIAWSRIAAAWTLALAALAVACTNNPYPGEDDQKKVLYASFSEAPRTLDPAVAYTTTSHQITGNVFDTLLEYHYLKRPYELIPGIATQVPVPEPQPDGGVAYHFELRPDLHFHEDVAFDPDHAEPRTRGVTSADVAFQLMRIADPSVNSPVIEQFSQIRGFRGFGRALLERRASDAGFAAMPVQAQYAALGGIEGLELEGALRLRVELEKPFPQILYWFAMPFTTPMAHEVVDYYDGREGRPRLADHPVGTGPYRLVAYDKQARMILERNEGWYGVTHPEWKAPGATYPSEGSPGDAEAGRLDPAYVGRPLPFIERVEFWREKESIPSFNKFLQGYYDASGVIKESFDRVVHEGGLSPEMAELGIRLEKSVSPGVYYIGFNMDDPVLGRDAGVVGRRLRQAMSLAIDSEEFTRLFLNGRGVPAQTPIPPGIFGYRDDYRNPYRQPDLDRARALLAEAGYEGGIDPETGKPLKLTFDTPDTSAQGRLRYLFFTDSWRQLGLDVEIAATTYNQFQEKVRNGAYQLFMWGWVADYPDPENFLFLLWSEMARSKNEGPNTANFSDAEYDELYLEMKAMPNGPERMAKIEEMLVILERERPWIELFHPEDYVLYHGWLANVKPVGMSTPTTKYRDIDAPARAAWRRAHNQPVVWPVYVVFGLAVIVLLPGIVTYMRERQ